MTISLNKIEQFFIFIIKNDDTITQKYKNIQDYLNLISLAKVLSHRTLTQYKLQAGIRTQAPIDGSGPFLCLVYCEGNTHGRSRYPVPFSGF